jgi:hypothetical protein
MKIHPEVLPWHKPRRGRVLMEVSRDWESLNLINGAAAAGPCALGWEATCPSALGWEATWDSLELRPYT